MRRWAMLGPTCSQQLLRMILIFTIYWFRQMLSEMVKVISTLVVLWYSTPSARGTIRAGRMFTESFTPRTFYRGGIRRHSTDDPHRQCGTPDIARMLST